MMLGDWILELGFISPWLHFGTISLTNEQDFTLKGIFAKRTMHWKLVALYAPI